MAPPSANPHKRPHPTYSTTTHDHPPSKRPRTTPQIQSPNSTNEPPTRINPLKKRIRSLHRLLTSDASSSLPATIRLEHEREISALKAELQDAEVEAERKEEERRRSRMIGRYHKVRFFERRKAERRLKGLRKEGAVNGGRDVDGGEDGRNGDDGVGQRRIQQRRAIHDAEVDLQYTVSYPLDEAYVSLFAAEESENHDEDKDEHANGDRQKPKMWYLVEEAMEKGSKSLEDLREGRWKERYQDIQVESQKNRITKNKPMNGISKSKKRKDMPGGKERDHKKPLLEKPKAQEVEPAKAEPDLSHMNRRMRRRHITGKDLGAARPQKAAPVNDDDEDGTGLGFFE